MSRFVLGNCIDVMARIPDNAIDFILTDPPYLVGFRDRSGRTIAGDKTDEWLQPACNEMYRVLKKDALMVSFYGWNRVDRFMAAWKNAGFSVVGHLVFTKNYTSKAAYVGYRHECAYILAKGRPRLPQNPLPDVLGWKYSGNRHHPTEKPVIRNLITESEVAVAGNSKFRFVGADAFSPDELRTDLFSDDEGGYVDCVALDAALLEKLQAVAEHLREAEGWEWCAGRMEPVGECREDAGTYRCLPEPEAVLTEAEDERLNELMTRYDALENQCEESDLLEAEMKLMRCMAKVRAWTPEMRAGSGVVVSWRYGNVCVQRGVQLRSEDDAADDADRTEQVQEKASVEEISLPLLTKMSSERTLAVQAALMQQPDKSLALLAWTLCLNVFGSGAYSKPAQISLECKHYSLTSDAPSGKEGAAFMAMMAEKARLAALLPEGWSRDMTTFLSLSQEVLLSLLSFCTACSIHGVQTRECGHTSRSPLDTLESAIGFHMRDWWQPTKANFFGHLKKPQIIAALNEAGLSGAARDAEKMKKGDAAEHAEFHMKDNRWVPGWMCAPRPQMDATEHTTNLADAA